jgi:Ran GTPase-activating protein (RanGAP) involved in mRNA processing and transport
MIVSARINHCNSLRELNLSENLLSDEELSKSIPSLKKLKRLDITRNRLQSGGILSNTISSLRGLKVLKACQN